MECRRLAGWINASGSQLIKMTYGKEDGSTVVGYNESGSGYLSAGFTMSGTSGGYVSGSTVTANGLFPTVASGSQTTYYCDGLWWNTSQTNFARVGGASANSYLCGLFYCVLNYAPSVTGWDVGASLSCKPAVS
jgi:hypothetical protein